MQTLLGKFESNIRPLYFIVLCYFIYSEDKSAYNTLDLSRTFIEILKLLIFENHVNSGDIVFIKILWTFCGHLQYAIFNKIDVIVLLLALFIIVDINGCIHTPFPHLFSLWVFILKLTRDSKYVWYHSQIENYKEIRSLCRIIKNVFWYILTLYKQLIGVTS